ncbi:uncharacterized protein LOC103385114 isoform X2 [Cynoglossus semilaevis]|uniref:uncharacterized protein LOC103385114 isoform X2 n=1 Tax=Cynoglossus semilaevis TaxID=244447 RepID=UPI000D62C543|nr:uncharacterized protein LOC103385114 isoform X2 [Cynoglossus semilaevis]
MQNRDNFKSFYVNWILRPAPLSPVVWPRLSLFHLRSAPNEPHGPGHRQQRRQTLCLGCLNSCTITERKHRQQRRSSCKFTCPRPCLCNHQWVRAPTARLVLLTTQDR